MGIRLGPLRSRTDLRHALALMTTLLHAGCPGPAATDHPARAPRPAPPLARAQITRSPFGQLPDGRAVDLYTLTQPDGPEVRVMTRGGTITVLRTPDRHGRLEDIVLGFDDLAGYLRDTAYLGALVGRFANRIAGGAFLLAGRRYTLARNDGRHTLHGGRRGFNAALFSATPVRRGNAVSVVLRHTSPDGDQGFPGTLRLQVTYTLTADRRLIIDYRATTDRPTPLNLTQHSYFNLGGPARRDILAHRLRLHASRYLPVDAGLIPTGERAPVAGTPFDFRQPRRVGARIDEGHPQLERGRGYDHTFVIDGEGLRPAASLADPASGRILEVSTTEPGVQLYTGNFLDGKVTGKGGRPHVRRAALCLETQHFPDSPNQPGFPSTLLLPGQTFRSRTVLTFGTKRGP